MTVFGGGNDSLTAFANCGMPLESVQRRTPRRNKSLVDHWLHTSLGQSRRR